MSYGEENSSEGSKSVASHSDSDSDVGVSSNSYDSEMTVIEG